MIPPLYIRMFNGLLSLSECDDIIDRSKRNNMTPAPVVTDSTASGVRPPDETRTSTGTYFQRGAFPTLAAVESRIAHEIGHPEICTELGQILHYAEGGEYKPHYDYFDPIAASSKIHMAHGGQRWATMIIYLNTPQAGGATIFPDVGVRIEARAGNALFFTYAPTPLSYSLHGGMPVLKGEKWILTKWFRDGPFV